MVAIAASRPISSQLGSTAVLRMSGAEEELQRERQRPSQTKTQLFRREGSHSADPAADVACYRNDNRGRHHDDTHRLHE
jgi:hypothetical protein